ncbi:hypothetical protein Tco_1569305 [Tanacetum coccineum]
MGYLVRAYYSISPTRYYKDDSWWSANLKSKATKDIISIGSFVEALVLNHYVLVRKILYLCCWFRKPSVATRTSPAAQAHQVLQTLKETTTTTDTAPTPTNSSSQSAYIPNSSQDVDELEPQPQHAQQQDDQAPL